MALSAESFPSKVTLVYLGKSRPLEGRRAELVEGWKKMLKITDDVVSVFGTEMLFKEGDREFWIAVQKPLIESMTREIAVGKPFTAYVIWMGAIKSEKHWEWLFAMNAFDSPTPGSYESSPRKTSTDDKPHKEF
jgi:hypothetical protein